MAITRPQAALALAGNRKHAGRSGSDLLGMLCVLVLATQLRALVSTFWLAALVSWGLAGRAFVQLVQGMFTIDLGVLVVAALVIFTAAGRRREVGRAFDLGCVTVMPLVVVQLVALVLARITGLDVPAGVAYGVGLAWTGSLVALAAYEARRPSVVSAATGPAKIAGIAISLVAAAGAWSQAFWVANHMEYVRPLIQGEHAPAFALPAIEEHGALGKPVTLADVRGKVVVVDFWATWCKPCLAAMPRLDAFTRAHPEVAVIAVNMDDAHDARALFDDRKYAMTLVTDDGDASERYGVSAIPHTVVIDKQGVVRLVARGGEADLESVITKLP
jgi:thiol-disulfide isomerase/thioredoxin